MPIDADASASTVFLVEKFRIPGIRNTLRVFGALVLGFVAMGDTGAHPSSHKFQVRMIESGEVLNELNWGDGEALLQDLEALAAGEFAERWLPAAELELIEG